MPANEQYLRNVKSMHVVFCVSVLAFAGSTVLMLYTDHKDEWREYQRQFLKAEARLLERERDAAVKSESGSQADYEREKIELEQRAKEVDAQLAAGNEQFDVLSNEVAALTRENDLLGRDVRFERAYRDVARANLDLGIRDQLSEDELASLKAEFDDKQSHVETLERQWEAKTTELKVKQVELAKITAERDALRDQLKKHTAEVSRIEEALVQIQPPKDAWLRRAKRRIMEWPIIDGFNSHLEVKQDWLPDLSIKLGMATTARFDRCRTCHLGIDRFAAGNVPEFPHGTGEGEFSHPYSGHPRPDVYLTSASPHPIAKFGCTVCHEGQGSATSFLNAQHGPNDPAQEHEWHEKYGHYHNHFWEYPMLPERLRDASCLKCHHDVIELGVNPTYGATAPKAYQGWQLIRQFGCFGCHEINGFDGKAPIGPDLRLEPTEEEEPKYAADPNLNRGGMRKVGPSLKHVAQKTTSNWIAYWTEEPKRFRPETRMPQFFGLTNLQDHVGQNISKAELAGIAHFLQKQSTDVDLLSPNEGYEPNAERGKTLLGDRGCLACHQHDDVEFKGAKADFAPNLTNVGLKLRPGKEGFNWLYTWIRDPQRHHPRSRMPYLFLEASDGPGGEVDPAADIAAFLIGDGPKEYPQPEYDPDSMKHIVELHLLSGKVLTTAQFEKFWAEQRFPLKKEQLKGDEVELVYNGAGAPSPAEWDAMLLNYVGRRSVSRYGCYGCHDINGYGTARPIGTALQDWGRKDTGRLALEHIEEFLHHHGERDGSSTAEYVEHAVKTAEANAFDTEEDRERGLRTSFFYESLLHHGRPGFIFQKLRDPRSYDYQKTATKKYTERLVMPKFPLDDAQIEAIATFVLGLVAEPQAEKYIYHPSRQARERNQGEILLQKYNCVGCHMIDLHELEYAVGEGELAATELQSTEHPSGMQALLNWRPPVPAYTGRTKKVDDANLPTVRMKGIPYQMPIAEDPVEDQVYAFDLWEPVALLTEQQMQERLKKGENVTEVVLPSARLVVPVTNLVKHHPPRGGHFAEWLVNRLVESGRQSNPYGAWQASPPPLFREGDKVQTNWLYRFLKDPGQIRHTLVLRMPRFNMSDEEAQTLANYFAAADGSEFPYQAVPQAEPAYLDQLSAIFAQRHPDRAEETGYLNESWTMLTSNLCLKCHAVGGREFKAVPNDPNVIRGPNLELVNQRLRPDWAQVWLYNPKWITPYTSMPLPFPRGKADYKPLFDGDPVDQTIGVRDALMNYYYLLERMPRASAQVQPAPAAAPQAQTN